MKKILIISLVMLAGCMIWPAAASTNPDLQNYRRAFDLIDSGKIAEAMVFANGRDPILNKVVRSIGMTQPNSAFTFAEMVNFMEANPEWPNVKAIQAAAEAKMPDGQPPQRVLAWFANRPAVSLAGFYRYAEALGQTGDVATLGIAVRKRWIEGDFTADELGAFHDRYPQMIDGGANWARLDRLLWKKDAAGARLMFPYVDGGMRALAEARLALATKEEDAPSRADDVPSGYSDDQGLLFERLRWAVRNNQDDEAVSLLRRAPDKLTRPDLWWEQRQAVARRLMMRKDYAEAYRLVAVHGQEDPKQLLEAEFLAGWLALRFMNDAAGARAHFQTVYDNAGTPVSRARGAYWLGRTYEALGDANTAQQAYETAAALNITYYGQLAAAKIYPNPTLSASPEPTIPANVRNSFYARDIVKAVDRLHDVGQREREKIYFRAAMNAAKIRAEFALLSELAYSVERPDLAIEAGKAASQKNMLMTSGGFPLLLHRVPPPLDPALAHALIRQESLFNYEAKSSAGAVGLMQLMPATAKEVAGKLGVRYQPERLTDPDYNIRLGSAFVQRQLDAFNGSYVLTLAGYNAGPRRVRDWMQQMGDPRQGDVDVVDWVEMIPFSETRNYVQRILESLQVYRSRLAGKPMPLQIVRDLKR